MTIPKLRFTSLLLFILIVPYISYQWFFGIIPYSQAITYLHDPNLTFVQKILNNYPQDLIFTVANGQVTANQPSPICIKLDPKNHVGILYDQNAIAEDFLSLSPTQPHQYTGFCEPLAMFTKTSVVWQDSDGYKINPISQDINTTITKEYLQYQAETILKSVLPIITPLYYIAPLVISIFILIGFLLTNYWYSWASRFFVKIITKQETNKKDIYRLSFSIFLALIILTTIIEDIIINKLLNIPAYTFNIPFFNTVVIAAIITYLVKSGKISSHQSTPSTPPPTPQITPTVKQ